MAKTKGSGMSAKSKRQDAGGGGTGQQGSGGGGGGGVLPSEHGFDTSAYVPKGQLNALGDVSQGGIGGTSVTWDQLMYAPTVRDSVPTSTVFRMSELEKGKVYVANRRGSDEISLMRYDGAGNYRAGYGVEHSFTTVASTNKNRVQRSELLDSRGMDYYRMREMHGKKGDEIQRRYGRK